MYGIDYLLESSYNQLAFAVAFIAMLIGSMTDLKKREVADWINFSIIFAAVGLRTLYAAMLWDYRILLDGLLGFAVFTCVAFAMFYLGQWGGGDAKMIIGLGTLFGLDTSTLSLYTLPSSMLASFLVNSLVLGSLYGIIWSIILVFKRWSQFRSAWNEYSRQYKFQKLLFISLGTCLVIAGLFTGEIGVFIATLGVIAYLMAYAYIYTKSIEKGCMLVKMQVSRITEGEWVAEDVKVKGKYITGPKELGISKEQIAKLKKLGVRNIKVKIGIPFIPAFLLGFIATFFFGDLAVFVVQHILM